MATINPRKTRILWFIALYLLGVTVVAGFSLLTHYFLGV